MNSFVNAVKNQEARTTNGMKARLSTSSACVDLFFKIGASRGKKITGEFTAAYVENRDYAMRIAQWARDIRQGSGERQIFRDILVNLAKNDPDAAIALMHKVPELGRWDDLLVLVGTSLESYAFEMVRQALEKGDGLCAKWMPRKGDEAVKLRAFLGWSPKFYRKRLVELTKVVETQMCAKQWDEINFNHVPSLASSRYKKAFGRHTKNYAEWATKLVSTDPKVKAEVKVNAGAVYPYDVLKGQISAYNLNYDKANINHITAQWEALPNYVGDASILPLVDVSGSMSGARAGGNQSKSMTTCLDVAVSIGLYLADKNKGAFKDTFLTFSGHPELLHLKGNIVQKIEQMSRSAWDMNTDLHKAIAKILEVAVKGNVPAEEMPKVLLILSDMQFDSCARFDDSALQMIKRKYEAAGYNVPQIVFWNINSHDNVPVKFNTKGVALVSGFSPAIVKNVLSADLEQFTPEEIMRKTIMVDRYNY